MDALLWIAVGLSVGWAASKLMLSSGDRVVSSVVAGFVGAVLGGSAMRLLGDWTQAGSQAGRVDMLVAALAGALWLSWATCVVTFGRRSDGELRARVGRAEPLDGRQEMLTYAAARDSLVQQLLGDAAAHDAGRYDEVGRRFDSIEREFPRGGAPELTRLRVALTFWDGWIDARNHGWQSSQSIGKDEWPPLARGVAADLIGDREITDARVRARFDSAAHGTLGDRVQTLSARLDAQRP
jgi:uncharacterized membrane protein YeaQ/YmgE (transglycosylase-associated protein family)